MACCHSFIIDNNGKKEYNVYIEGGRMFRFDKNVILETEHLILRFIDVNDHLAIYNNVSHDKEVLKYFFMNYQENVDEDVVRRIINFALKNERYVFSIILKETNEVIGFCLQCSSPSKQMNTVEVGYAIGKKYWNNGYGTECLQALINFMFSLGVHKVIANHIVENTASGRIMEKCHMIYQGTLIDEIYYHDEYHDCKSYYIINPND